MPAAPPAAPPSGLLLFIRYAFMPNNLGYCGGNENEVLFEHAVEGRPDPRLAPLLVKFTGAVPYLRTIAASHMEKSTSKTGALNAVSAHSPAQSFAAGSAA